MSDLEAIHLAMEQAGLRTTIRSMRSLAGGCIHKVTEITLADGFTIVAKTNDSDAAQILADELHSLQAINRNSLLLAPRPIIAGAMTHRAVLLMTCLKRAPNYPSEGAWRQFGRELAAFHLADAGTRYGFDRDNHIGSTPQPNAWHDDWVEFNAVNRLGYQVALAADNDLLESSEIQSLEWIINQLDRYIPRRPRPSLLHGDLWSGNALPCLDESDQCRIAVIDPACSIGDGWADIAMMKLFGGFPPACFDSYAQVIPRPDDLESRLAVYSLYHVLNHVNLFGRGYVPQAMALAAELARRS